MGERERDSALKRVDIVVALETLLFSDRGNLSLSSISCFFFSYHTNSHQNVVLFIDGASPCLSIQEFFSISMLIEQRRKITLNRWI